MVIRPGVIRTSPPLANVIMSGMPGSSQCTVLSIFSEPALNKACAFAAIALYLGVRLGESSGRSEPLLKDDAGRAGSIEAIHMPFQSGTASALDAAPRPRHPKAVMNAACFISDPGCRRPTAR